MNWLVQTLRAIAAFARSCRSPLIKTPGHRTLFTLVVVGVLLICTLPEAAFVIPALEAVGLDIVTILVALELRHYLVAVAPIKELPKAISWLRRLVGPFVNRCVAITVAPGNPNIWPYACTTLRIAALSLMGSGRVPAKASG